MDVLPDLGNLIVSIALLFSFLIVLLEWLGRRRERQRERRLLDAIDREYWAYIKATR
jgi:sensor c-di-GMP phosphodiesterase-like protein